MPAVEHRVVQVHVHTFKLLHQPLMRGHQPDAMAIEQQVRRVLFGQQASQASDHGQGRESAAGHAHDRALRIDNEKSIKN